MVRVLAVSDSDSYLKWTSATLAAMPSDWERDQLVIGTPITPSADQIRAATGAEVSVVSLSHLIRLLITERPEVLLLGCTGPVVQAILLDPRLRRRRARPVLITGLPGLSIPASARAVEFRAACDLFVVHSHRERADFARLGWALARDLQFVLARLPFLDDQQGLPPAGLVRRDLVFAAQAKVPVERTHREQVLEALAQAPGRSAVVKLRAAVGEEQTHREAWPYPVLWEELVQDGRVHAGSVRFSTGPMADALDQAKALVTVSSTAALEAMARDVPVLIVSDFGVSAEMINDVFRGSGCLGTLDDVRAGRSYRPNAEWRRDNYFHPPEDSDWLPALMELLERRATAGLPARALRPVGSSAALARRQLRMVLPAPAWQRLRAGRRRWRAVAGALRRRGRTARARRHDLPPVSASDGRPPAPPVARPGPPPATPPPASPRDH